MVANFSPNRHHRWREANYQITLRLNIQVEYLVLYLSKKANKKCNEHNHNKLQHHRKKAKRAHYYGLKILRKPADLQQIIDAEQALDLTFNDELKELYLFADGTELDEVTPCGLTGLIPIHTFLSLKDAIAYYHQSMEFEESFYNHTKAFAPGKKVFPFLEDGAGNCYWVDLNECTPNYGKIYWTNTFGTEPDYSYNSLTSMFSVIAEAYDTGIINVDAEGYLDCDYPAFEQLSEGR